MVASRSRSAPAVLVAAILAATAVAFVFTERLKLTPSPIVATKVTKLFSPICGCGNDVATVSFRLRGGDRVSVEIIDGGRHVIREIVRDAPKRRGRVMFVWDGRDESGAVVPDGVYKPRIHLTRQRRTIIMPNPIRVDTTPPEVTLVRLRPHVISPDGDGRSDRVVARFRASEPSRVALYIDGERRTLKRGRRQHGTIEWDGKLDGVAARPGVYRVTIGAADVAGNVGKPTSGRQVTVRYVALGRTKIRAVPGGTIAVLVLSDARAFHWRLGPRSGSSSPRTLRLRAPLQPGRYTLTVAANGFSTRAAVFVARPPA